ncbi:WD40 repeat domain-containing protein, partial [Anabaena sp. CCY 9402-a]|uniref:WD40 repeat domain-containing protein n=1 Tax=Anabaena sp. CCY 9402-a TaxID=3103867 RepID=UPI0039C721FE
SFSPDGKTLASGSGDKTIKLWNLETGKEIRTLNGHSEFVWSVSFSPDGKTLASGSDDKTIKLWNLETGKEIRTLNGHSERVSSVSFSPDSKTLASGSWDNTIKLWNLPDLELDPLIRNNCDFVRGYLENNPDVSESDRHLCDGIGSK